MNVNTNKIDFNNLVQQTETFKKQRIDILNSGAYQEFDKLVKADSPELFKYDEFSGPFAKPQILGACELLSKLCEEKINKILGDHYLLMKEKKCTNNAVSLNRDAIVNILFDAYTKISQMPTPEIKNKMEKSLRDCIEWATAAPLEGGSKKKLAKKSSKKSPKKLSITTSKKLTSKTSKKTKSRTSKKSSVNKK